jgi:hypothetical protein
LWQPPRFDGTRDTDSVFQREIDETLDDLVRDFGVGAAPLGVEDPDGWVGEILDGLGIPGEPPQRSLFR